MEMDKKTVITVQTEVNAPIGVVWRRWTSPEDIVRWNNASDDWHTPHAVNDLRVGGKFNYRMEARDKSFGFDFNGVYDAVVPRARIDYTIEGGER